MKQVALCLTGALAFGMATTVQAKTTSLTLVREGQPTAQIQLAEQPTRAAQLAAFELQWHVQQITGATLPILKGEPVDRTPATTIYIGKSAGTEALKIKDDLAMQEYLVKFLPEGLVLMGTDKQDTGEVKYDPQHLANCYSTWPTVWEDQATLYAVYDFLERQCGVRWLTPTETGTVIPKKATLTVTGDELRRKPFFRYRGGTMVDGNVEGYYANTSLWRAGTPQFTESEAQAFPALRAQYANEGQFRMELRGRMRLYLLRMRAGGEKCNVNHSLYYYYDKYWAQTPGLEKVFVEKRPQYFAQGYEGEPPQLCYTNPDLIKQVAQDAHDYFTKGGYPNPSGRGVHPGYQWGENFFAVEPMDNSSFCKCENCMKFTHEDNEHVNVYSTGRDSDYFFNFVNQIAREVKKTDPTKRVATLSYMSHAWPPKTIKLDKDVAVQFCFASNRNVWCPREYNNELAALKAWRAEDKDRPLYLWLYYTFPKEIADNGKFNCFPGFFAHTIDKQMKLFKSYNIQGMFHCGWGQEVEAYVTFKLMDDPTLKVNDILNDYFTGLYGAAAKPMRQLYEGIEATYSDPKNYPEDIRNGKRGSHQTVQFAWEYLGTAERMAKFQQLMDAAKNLAKSETEKRNVTLFEVGVWSYMTTGRNNYVTRQNAPIPNITAPRVAPADGDVAKVDWAKAAELGGTWFDRGQDKPAARRLAGRIAHDGKFLYLELTDPCDTTKLVTAAQIFPFDDWEIFIAKQRAMPSRQYAVAPSGAMVWLSHGEVNWRMNVKMESLGIKATPIITPDKWVTRFAMPLDTMVEKGIAPGQSLFMNILRVTSPAVAGGGGLGIDTWVSYCTVHEVDRLAEIKLAK